jgi:hypothetical protein
MLQAINKTNRISADFAILGHPLDTKPELLEAANQQMQINAGAAYRKSRFEANGWSTEKAMVPLIQRTEKARIDAKGLGRSARRKEMLKTVKMRRSKRNPLRKDAQRLSKRFVYRNSPTKDVFQK